MTPQEYAKIIALLADDRHVIEFRDDGWTIAHPLRERIDGSLFDCRFTWAYGDVGKRGRFYMGLDAYDGEPTIEEEAT